jgi:hypothetical protein
VQFYPDDAEVPTTLRTEHLYLTMLAPEHVERDYDAFMSSMERLNAWSGGRWPTPDFTLEMNMDDMRMHSSEHKAREAFTFTVMNHEETRCEGCVYINGWEQACRHMGLSTPPNDRRDFDAITSFWVRDSAMERELDRELVSGLLEWFGDEWAFGRTLFLVNRDLTRDIQVLEDAGLDRLYTFETAKRPGEYYIYGAPA